MGKRIVLLYHRVNSTESDYNRITVEEDNFYKQMSYLKNNYKIVSFEEMISCNSSEDMVSVTFDDGFADFYEKALPILSKLQIPVTVFITTGQMDTNEELWTTEIIRILFSNRSGNKQIHIKMGNRILKIPVFTVEQRAEAYAILRNILMQLPKEERDETVHSLREQLGVEPGGREAYRLLSEAQCRRIAKNPLVTIGAHTVNHCSLGRVSEKEACREILESIRKLEMTLGQRVKYFAYPFGGQADYSAHVMDSLRQNNIEAACIVKAENYDKDRDSIYEIPRYYIGNWTPDQFQSELSKWTSGEEIQKQDEEEHIYIGKIENDTGLWKSDKNVVIWGTGIRGKRIYGVLCQYGQRDRIAAFADNNPELWGQSIDHIPILSMEQIKSQRNIEIIIYNTHDIEIIRQLEPMGLGKIHCYI